MLVLPSIAAAKRRGIRIVPLGMPVLLLKVKILLLKTILLSELLLSSLLLREMSPTWSNTAEFRFFNMFVNVHP